MVSVDDYLPEASEKPAVESAEAALDKSSMKKIVHRVIDSLPVQYRTVITLFYLEELSYKEIEVITGMPDGTIKSYLNRGRLAIREGVLKLVPDMRPELTVTK